MSLDRVPILASDMLNLEYSGQQTRGYLTSILFDADRFVCSAGFRRDELPNDLFEAQVFINFLWGASGEFSVNGSASMANWRWMRAVTNMARKIGAASLVADLEESWEEVQTFPEDLLDAFDRGMVIGDGAEAAISAEDNWPPWATRRRVVPQSLIDRIGFQLDSRWQSEIDQTPLTSSIDPPGDGEYQLENAVAAYLSRAALPLEIHAIKQSLDAAIAELVLDFDDYEIRLGRMDSRSPLRDLERAVQARRPGTKRGSLKYPERLRSYADGLNNSKTVAEDGFLISEVLTNECKLITAYFSDKAQLIDPKDWVELAVIDLLDQCRLHPKATTRLSYLEAGDWTLSEDYRPSRV